ncbi:GNRHR [Mytilus edulis]|uniref:GNRHR n=1 Tax=Mytilus edulis TaxID=6550 RepID=A0A8S3QL17_MYTED|nr:GNRHR [Mytilus edulis]
MHGDNITQIYVNKTIFANDTANDINRQNKIFEGIFKWISFSIFTGIVILNTIVIGLLMKRKQKSRMGFFVANLAYAGKIDLIAKEDFERSFKSCDLDNWLDRMNVMVKPLSTVTRLKTYRYGLALSAWILGSLLAIQYVVHVTYYSPQKHKTDACRHEFLYDLEIRYFDLCVLIIIPLIFIITCYIMIFLAINRRQTYGFIATKSNNDGVNERINFNAKMRTLIQLFVVAVVYMICWTPLFSASLLEYYGVLKYGITFRVLYGLAPLNSLTNPVVFLLFNYNMFYKDSKSSKKCTISLKTNSASTNLNAMEL